MRLVIPAGRARLWAVAAAGVFLLGWLSALGSAGSGGGLVTVAAANGLLARPASGATQPLGHGPSTAPTPSTGPTQAAGQSPEHPVPQKAPGQVPALPGLSLPRWPTSKTIRHQQAATDQPVDCHHVKCIALTFDDGPGPYTTRLLAMLASQHAKVTFFLIGGNIRGRENIVRQEVAQGHVVGDHTWDHRDLSHLSSDAIRRELVRTRDEIVKVTGRPVRLMRPPYGATDKSVGEVARRLKLSQILWDVDTQDWLDRNSAIVAHRAVSWAHRGDIILVHDIHPTTVNAVPKILRGLAKRGFTLVTVPELLAAHPLKPGKVYFDEG